MQGVRVWSLVWTWVWVNSGSWWWTGRPGVLRVMGSQRFRHDWETELNWIELMFIEPMMPSNHLILYHPLLFLPSIFPSIRVFSNESVLRMRWPKYWSFSFIISPSNEHPGLISFRMDWLDLLAVQGPSRVFSNTTVQKYHSGFFVVQLSHPYMTTGKNDSFGWMDLCQQSNVSAF